MTPRHQSAEDEYDFGACTAAPPGDSEPAEEVPLTGDAVDILEMERSWWKYPGAKETAVQDRFSWTMTRYYQVLNALIDTSAALAHDPVTVNRLRRLRATRQGARQQHRNV